MSDTVLISRNSGPATIELKQGNTFSLTIDVAGAGSNISAATMVITSRLGAAALTLTSTPASGITVNDNDTITVALTAAQTAALSTTWYRYDLKFTLANGSILTWMSGLLDIIR